MVVVRGGDEERRRLKKLLLRFCSTGCGGGTFLVLFPKRGMVATCSRVVIVACRVAFGDDFLRAGRYAEECLARL